MLPSTESGVRRGVMRSQIVGDSMVPYLDRCDVKADMQGGSPAAAPVSCGKRSITNSYNNTTTYLPTYLPILP